jgi:hypothetical protein
MSKNTRRYPGIVILKNNHQSSNLHSPSTYGRRQILIGQNTQFLPIFITTSKKQNEKKKILHILNKFHI